MPKEVKALPQSPSMTNNQTVAFSQDEFEKILKTDTLVFRCNTCDTNWPPSSADIAKKEK